MWSWGNFLLNHHIWACLAQHNNPNCKWHDCDFHLLALDDWGLATLTASESRDILDIKRTHLRNSPGATGAAHSASL